MSEILGVLEIQRLRPTTVELKIFYSLLSCNLFSFVKNRNAAKRIL